MPSMYPTTSPGRTARVQMASVVSGMEDEGWSSQHGTHVLAALGWSTCQASPCRVQCEGSRAHLTVSLNGGGSAAGDGDGAIGKGRAVGAVADEGSPSAGAAPDEAVGPAGLPVRSITTAWLSGAARARSLVDGEEISTTASEATLPGAKTGPEMAGACGSTRAPCSAGAPEVTAEPAG